jgi:hypothetical protein
MWNVFGKMFVFAVVGFSKCKPLYLNEREKCYGRQIYASNLHKKVKKYTYVIISENTLCDMLSNPHDSCQWWGLSYALGGKSAEYLG